MNNFQFCLNCYNVYDENALTGITCPNVLCNDKELINIDVDLFCVLPQIISSGFTIKINEDIETSTKSFCINLSTLKSFINETAPAYIIFENDDEKKINEQYNICKNILSSYSNSILISEISTENGKKSFTILTNKAAIINEVFKTKTSKEINKEIETKELVAVYYVFKAVLLKYLFSLKEYLEKNEIKI